jgi:hypothetical protein
MGNSYLFENTYDSLGRLVVQDDGVSTNKLTQFQYDEMHCDPKSRQYKIS